MIGSPIDSLTFVGIIRKAMPHLLIVFILTIGHLPYSTYYKAELNLFFLLIIGITFSINWKYLWHALPENSTEKSFLILLIYLLINGLTTNKASNQVTNLILQTLLLFFSLKISLKHCRAENLYTTVLGLSTIILFVECAFCVMQYLGKSTNINGRYLIGGISGHPGITMCSTVLPMSLVVPGNLFQNPKSRTKLIFSLTLLLMTLALAVFLKSRASVAVIVVVLGVHLYRTVKIAPIWKRKIIPLTGLAFISGLAVLKFNSTLGRLSIWKKCISILSDTPMFGRGLGNFIAEFNNYQRGYFSANQHLLHDKSAEYTSMAYNDFLEIGVETGGIGMLLLMITFGGFFKNQSNLSRASSPFTTFYSGIALVIIMLTWSLIKTTYFLSFFTLIIILSNKSHELKNNH